MGESSFELDDIEAQKSKPADVPGKEHKHRTSINDEHQTTEEPHHIGEAPLVDETQPDEKSATAEAPAEPDAEHDDGQTVYPGKAKLLLVMLALYLAGVLVALDRSITAPAIPSITNDFDSLADIGWYATAYLLPSCAFQLTFARIYTFYNTKWVFLTSIGLFEIGSAISGGAPNSGAFIAGRVISGVGSAGLFNGVIVMMIPILPLSERPKWQGGFGAIFGLGMIVGPLIGGAITTHSTWRWCFYINLPIGGLSILIILFTLSLPSPSKSNTPIRRQIEQLDPIGNLFFLPGIVCLLLALQWGGSTFPWNNVRIIVLFVVSGVCLVIFGFVQIWKQDDAMIPPRIIKNRSIFAATMFSFFLPATMLVLTYYLPIWFQAIKGASAQMSGVMILPTVLGLIIGAVGGGFLVSKTGYYAPMMIASGILLPVGAGLFTTFEVDTSPGKWIGYQIIFGFAIGLGFQQTNIVAQATLQKIDIPTGTSLMSFCQTLGASIFIIVTQNVLGNLLVSDLSGVPGIDVGFLLGSGATSFRNTVPADQLNAILVAYNDALTTAFYVPLATSLVCIFAACAIEWKNVKGKKLGPPQ